ncbi:ribosomal protein L7/L12 [Limnoglobus roseus]|uniref:50S ribosomal protein L7/L12 n=1 Tax=Limnoglobus roseus TaxID=2598579 RepID=A0A5C1AFN4_9BACT|nr:ribosomal protein L7/L12 [Limnoglobus roseus]QEL17033.1 50S ribosomal protein L7/L12 [Limnoglobus roseus]
MEFFAIPAITMGFIAIGIGLQILQKLTRIEQHLARVLPPVELSAAAKLLAADPRQKIAAIQTVRQETGLSLAEAKEAVETYIRGQQS